MKVALVNLCVIEDFALSKHARKSFEFLVENFIDYVDYVSGRTTDEELLEGFHLAVNNPEVDLIWFIQGGDSMSLFLDRIAWRDIQRTGKKYLGLSDFTNFSLTANSLGQNCYYGQGLKRIKDYLPHTDDRLYIVDFLKHGKLPNSICRRLDGSNETIDLNESFVTGGYSLADAKWLPKLQLKLQDTFLFFEHHNSMTEPIENAEKALSVILDYCTTTPVQGIILGHSMIADPNGGWLDQDLVNQRLTTMIKPCGPPVYSVDHFKTIIPLKIART